MQQVYGIDVEDRALMRARSWRWLRARIRGLLSVPPVYVRASDGEKSWLMPIPQTRIAYAMHPPGKD